MSVAEYDDDSGKGYFEAFQWKQFTLCICILFCDCDCRLIEIGQSQSCFFESIVFFFNPIANFFIVYCKSGSFKITQITQGVNTVFTTEKLRIRN